MSVVALACGCIQRVGILLAKKCIRARADVPLSIGCRRASGWRSVGGVLISVKLYQQKVSKKHLTKMLSGGKFRVKIKGIGGF